MKKAVGIFFIFLMGMSDVALAADRGSAEYQRLVEVKRAQREKKAAAKAQGLPAEKNFWQREASRSGLAGTAAMFGNVVSGVVPLDKPNSRKNNDQ